MGRYAAALALAGLTACAPRPQAVTSPAPTRAPAFALGLPGAARPAITEGGARLWIAWEQGGAIVSRRWRSRADPGVDSQIGAGRRPAVACDAEDCVISWLDDHGLQLAIFDARSGAPRGAARPTPLGDVDDDYVLSPAGSERGFTLLLRGGTLLRLDLDGDEVRVNELSAALEMRVGSSRVAYAAATPAGLCLDLEETLDRGCLPHSDADRDCRDTTMVEARSRLVVVDTTGGVELGESCETRRRMATLGGACAAAGACAAVDARAVVGPHGDRLALWLREPAGGEPTAAVDDTPIETRPAELATAPEPPAGGDGDADEEATALPVGPIEAPTPAVTERPAPLRCGADEVLLHVHRGPARSSCAPVPARCQRTPTCACLKEHVCADGGCRDIAARELGCYISR
ncbi:MAG: hypothetical protein H6713_37835 [Myxococcales bacterium]|nr:hypothetical protein [Myxococcales bacterium]